MKPILPSDLERLREQIRRVKGGRMEPNPQPTGPDTCVDQDGIPGGGFDGPAFFTGEQPERYDAEKVLDGEVMENQWGRYFVSERFYPAHHRHGSMEISQLGEMPAELLTAISRDKIPGPRPGALGLSRYRDHRSGRWHRYLRLPRWGGNDRGRRFPRSPVFHARL